MRPRNPEKPFIIRCKKTRAHSSCAHGWTFSNGYNYYGYPKDAEDFLKVHPLAEPVTHKRHGIGWSIPIKQTVCWRCKKYNDTEYVNVFFYNNPDLMVQEIMYHQQKEKLEELKGSYYEI